MPNNQLYDFFRQLDQDGVVLSYKGYISPELIASILKIVEDKLENTEHNSVIRKKVYNILVESLQNLYHHVDSNPNSADSFAHESRSVIVSVIKERNTYFIQTGNFIKNESLNTLLQKIDVLNELNVEELKSLYQQRLNAAVISDKGTAGLGLIDMLRKSGNKIEYAVTKINSEVSFLCVQIKINSEK
jgi:HJR/Mrr/RecB family endonuclease